jgi:hypothetical protein
MATTFAVPDGRVAMAATTYTGTGATLAVSNAVNSVGMQPDLLWIKNRTAANSNQLADSIRGVTKYIFSDAFSVEETRTDQVTAFSASGFSLSALVVNTAVNNTGNNYVGWQWKAGGTAVTNGAGTISSQISANVTTGFSILTWTGTGATGTLAYGLGVTPGLIIIKQRSPLRNWCVWHTSFASASNTSFLYLNSTIALGGGGSANAWNNTLPTNSVITLGTDLTNETSNTYVGYVWAPVAGYSAFGSYTGNGSADGPFIYTGFRPRWIMVKRTDATLSWGIFDTSRNASNVVDLQLYANLAVADNTFTTMDILSNGFKSRSATEYNTSGGTYIYAAFAENPLKYANAR